MVGTIVMSSLGGMLIFGFIICNVNRIRKTKRRLRRGITAYEIPYKISVLHLFIILLLNNFQ